ncbi:MAG: chromate transporter [Muribaculaceae bacterium]|nr:chromate transporter [Muribaculaceae bacterium]
MTKNNILFQLFLSFFKIGGFTFGGGWAMISLIEREIVDKHKWIERTEFLDLLAVAQSLPGILAVNMAVVTGDKLRGLRGSVAAAVGTILPCFCIILGIAIFLTPEMITSSATLTAIFKGIRPVVVALIVTPVITSARAAGMGLRTLWIPAVVALAIWSKWPVVSNPILYITAGALGGWWLTHRSRRALAEGKEGDAK